MYVCTYVYVRVRVRVRVRVCVHDLLVPSYYTVLIVNLMGRIPIRGKRDGNHLKILCQPICIWLYMYIHMYMYMYS